MSKLAKVLSKLSEQNLAQDVANLRRVINGRVKDYASDGRIEPVIPLPELLPMVNHITTEDDVRELEIPVMYDLIQTFLYDISQLVDKSTFWKISSDSRGFISPANVEDHIKYPDLDFYDRVKDSYDFFKKIWLKYDPENRGYYI